MSDRMRKLLAYRLAAVLILLAGFALRVYLLDGQSFWSDEGLSIYRARLGLSELLQNVITIDGVPSTDTNPPLYFLWLHMARAIMGESVFALRYQGVIASMVAMALMFPWLRLFASRRAAVAAAFFLAISPFHIWESQILRNYPLLIALNLLSVYGLFRFILRPQGHRRWRWPALWLLAGLLGIYTHYFAFFVFAYGLLGLGLWLAVQRAAARRAVAGHRFPWKKWLPLGLAFALLLPAVAMGVERFAAGRQIDFQWVPPAHVAQHVVAAFSVGISRTMTHPWWLWLPSLLLAILGLANLWRKSRPAALLLLGYLLVPLSLLVLLSSFNPLYNGVRHLLIGLPPYVALMGLGVGESIYHKARTPARRAVFFTGLMLAPAVVVIQFNNLNAQFNDSSFVRDDVRGAAQYLTQVAAAGDVVILHDALIRPTFEYYYRGAADVVAIPPYGRPDVETATRLLLEKGTAERIWFLTQPVPRTGFPRDYLSRLAAEEWISIHKRQFPSLWLPVRLEAYVAGVTERALPARATPAGVVFGDELRLDGYELPATVQAGAPWWGRFYLTPLNETGARHRLSLELMDESGQVWAQADETILPNYNPASWTAGEILRHDQEFTVPAGVPSGEYTVQIRLLSDNGAVLPAEDGAAELSLGAMTVDASRDPAQLALYTPQPARLGPIEFLGYRLPEADLRPGHLMTIEAIWQARRAPQQDYTVKLEMLDNTGRILTETVSSLTRQSRPTSIWQAGEVNQGRLKLEIPAAATEDVVLRLTLLDAEGQPAGRSIQLQERPKIELWPLETELPAIAYPLPAGFSPDIMSASLITLHGYDAPDSAQPGSIVEVTFVWQSMENLDRNLLVFIHMTDDAGNIVAQADGVPVNGTRLSLSWRAGEVFVDEHALQLPANLLPGTYQLWVGFYDPDTGVRLIPRTDATDWPDGRLPFAQLTLQESP